MDELCSVLVQHRIPTTKASNVEKASHSLKSHSTAFLLLDMEMESAGSFLDEIAALKKQRARLEAQRRSSAAAAKRMNMAVSLLTEAPPELTEWNESTIRQLVDTVKVISAEEILVYLQDGTEIPQKILV